MYEIIRTEEEIEKVMNWAEEGQLKGSHFRGMKYEDGLRDMFEWLTDKDADNLIQN